MSFVNNETRGNDAFRMNLNIYVNERGHMQDHGLIAPIFLDMLFCLLN